MRKLEAPEWKPSSFRRSSAVFDLPPRAPGGPNGSSGAAAPEPVALGMARLCWGQMVGRDGRVAGFRLEIAPESGAAPPPLAALLDGVVAALSAEGSSSFPRGLVLLAPTGFAFDPAMADWSAPRNVLLEVEASVLDDERTMRTLFEARRQGVRQALRVGDRLPARERLQFFQYLVGTGEKPPVASIPWVALDACPAGSTAARQAPGATYVVPRVLPPARTGASEEFSAPQRAIFRLVRLLRSDADLHLVERVFESEPLLAYMLLTLANSAAFRRGSPTASLRQAVMAIGYRRLVKWLVLILAVSHKEARVAPLVHRALVRGYCMEGLAHSLGWSGPERDESFIVGAFTLLDGITGQTLDTLLEEVGLPAPVVEALLGGSGPYAPLLDSARRFEASPGQPASAAETGTEPLPPATGGRCAQAEGATPFPADARNVALLAALASTDSIVALS